MSNDRPKPGTMAIEEATISKTGEMAAIVEVLERKGYNSAQQRQSWVERG